MFKVHALGEKTGIYLLENFLTPQECKTLIQDAQKKGMQDDCERVRGSKEKIETCKWTHLENNTPCVNKIHHRMGDITLIPPEHGEPIIVVQYGPETKCHPHNDYRPYRKKDPRSGRVAQILFFLNSIDSGGETLFTELGMKIQPKKGRALLWYGIEDCFLPNHGAKGNLFPEKLSDNPYAYHRTIPIDSGEQWVAVKYFHAHPL